MKLAAIVKLLMVLLTGFLLLVGVLYLMMSLVKPYEGPPPKHGSVRNKVLYCDFGYEKQGNQCVVQEGINLEAEYFARELVRDLRMEYGDYDCAHTTGFPSRNVREIIEGNENLELRKANLLFQQAELFLKDQDNKQ